MPLIRSCKSHDPGNSSGGLAQFEKKLIYLLLVFFLAFLFIESSQFHVLDHVFDLLTRVGCGVRSRLFLLFFFALISFLNLYF
jgi:flagellar biosynthesis protein FlhB